MTITVTSFERSLDRGRGLARDTRVRWALEEVHQPYEVRLLSIDAMKEPASRAACSTRFPVSTTNKTLGGAALWAFMCGRGTQEQVYGELKRGFAFGCVPTMRYAANSAWQILSVLAFNLVRGFQLATTAERRPATRKRRTLFRFETIHTLRYLCFGRAGVLLYPDGDATLDIGPAPAVAERFKRLDRLLAA